MSSVSRLRRPSQDQLISPQQGRKVLSPRASAALLRTPGHDCSTIKADNVAQKVMARLGHSLQRFAISFGWECLTVRGKTRYNGGRTYCGQGKCEAAHAALSPTLYDDKLQRVQKELEKSPFSVIKEISKLYLLRRFSLSETDKENLSHSSQEKRIKSFTEITGRLSRRQRKGSIADSSLEKTRNATYSNPRSSNRFDCYLERTLRKVEDELADECASHSKAPEEALAALIKVYSELLEKAVFHLEEEKKDMEEFSSAWDRLIEAQKALEKAKPSEKISTFKDYKSAITAYLDLYQTRQAHQKQGVSRQKSLMKALKQEQSLRLLKHIKGMNALDSDWFAKNQRHLKTSEKIVGCFQKAALDITLRHEEAQLQQNEMPRTAVEVHEFVKNTLGVKDSQGNLITPTKTPLGKELAETLRRPEELTCRTSLTFS